VKYDSSIEVLRAAAEKYQKQIGFEKSTLTNAKQDAENSAKALVFLEQERDKLLAAVTHLQEDQEVSV